VIVHIECLETLWRLRGFYYYQKHTLNKPEDPEHQEMLRLVKQIAEETDYSYGSRCMKKALNLLSFPVNREKARKLMKEAGVAVKSKRKYKVTTNSNHKQPVFENRLKRDFSPLQPNQVYALDILGEIPEDCMMNLIIDYIYGYFLRKNE
jgi:putative transposase